MANISKEERESIKQRALKCGAVILSIINGQNSDYIYISYYTKISDTLISETKRTLFQEKRHLLGWILGLEEHNSYREDYEQ